MKYIQSITDRTRLDVSKRTRKGYMNLSDWLRIYGNVRLLHTIESTMIGAAFTEIREMDSSSIVTSEEVNTLVNNIRSIGFEWVLPSLWNSLRNDWGGNDSPKYSDVNAWESVTDALLNTVIAAFTDWDTSTGTGRFPRADNAICGTGMTRQNGFRRYA